MTRDQLKQYRKLNQEIEQQQKVIDSLYRRLESLPTHMGKVQASEKEWPYIKRSVTVPMDDPAARAHLEKLIAIKEGRVQRALELREEIEEYIAMIDDPTDRMIFEGIYIDGKTHWQIAESLCTDRSTVSHRIEARLRKDNR